MSTKKISLKTIAVYLLAISFAAFSIDSNAQLKLYPNGSLSIGSIIQPPANTELEISGNTIFSANTGAIASAAFIKGRNIFSNAANPDYTWYGDTTVGIFHPAANTMAFTVAGKMTVFFSPGNNIVIDSSADNGDRVQINAGVNQNPVDVFSHASTNNLYSAINWVNNTTTKAWAVKNGNQDEFFVYGNGQAYSFGWNTISDSTLKENVLTIHDALRKTLQLQGVTYNLKVSNAFPGVSAKGILPTPARQMGLIAQAVERVVPEVVTTNGNGIKTIAYSNLVGLLVEAIKEENSRVGSLQTKLDSCITAIKLNNAKQFKNIKPDSTAILYPCAACPMNQQVTFHCYIPSESKTASLMVFDMSGALKKTIEINGKQQQLVNVNKGELSAGMYYYSLMIDHNEIDTRKVIITRY